MNERSPAPTSLPSVVVVLLNWCSERDTVDCIESLRRATYPALRILLVDNGSSDGSGDRLHARFPDLSYLPTGANLGYAGGNNRGFERALADGAEFILVLNNDTIVDPTCVEWLVNTAQATNAALVSPKILYHDAPDTIWFAGGDFSPLRVQGRHRGEGTKDSHTEAGSSPITFATGCCFLIRSSVLRKLGGFDESYFIYVEDTELSVRLSRAGEHLLYEPRARVLHRIPRGRQTETPFQIRQRDRNRRRLSRTHFGLVRRLAFGAWFYLTRAVHFARYTMKGAWPEAAAIWVGAFGSLQTAATPSDVVTRPKVSE
ncbi:MAG TPA: glycosyltransferase family 2 protein [Gemmatimonadaceae bacterium]|jgi:hypothetical protein